MNEPMVILSDLPTTVRGLCYHDDDGNAFIILNARMPREIQMLTYRHELLHIQRGEMYDQNYFEYGA